MTQKQNLLFQKIVLLVGVIVVFFHSTKIEASRRNYQFDDAYRLAAHIVLGKVVKRTQLKSKKRGEDQRIAAEYDLVVEKTYKGSLKPGQIVRFLDGSYHTSAQLEVGVNARNIAFLHEDEWTKKLRVDFGIKDESVRTVLEILPEEVPDWGAYRDSSVSFRLKDKFQGWTRLLEFKLLSEPNLLQEYRVALQQRGPSSLLLEIIKRWPRPLDLADQKLFRDTLLKSKSEEVKAALLPVLLNSKFPLPLDDLRREITLAKSRTLQSVLLPWVNSANIQTLQEPLYSWLVRADMDLLKSTDTIRVLGKYSPEWLKAKLPMSKLDFAEMIFALNELKITGADVSRPKYTKELLHEPNFMALQTFRDISKGNTFSFTYFLRDEALKNPKEREAWAKYLPVMEPYLTIPAGINRKLMIAAMRTLGADIQIKNSHYAMISAIGGFPLKVSIEAPTDISADLPSSLRIVERASSKHLYLIGPLECWSLKFRISDEKTFASMTNLCDWEKSVRQNKSDYVSVSADFSRSTVIDLSQILNRYRGKTVEIFAELDYPFDGLEFQLDAWTGVIRTETVKIKVN